MAGSKILAYDGLCPDCGSDLGYSMKEHGYFCGVEGCIYSRAKSWDKCFGYFPDEEPMRFVRTWSWIESHKKKRR